MNRVLETPAFLTFWSNWSSSCGDVRTSVCRRCKKQVQHENASPYEFWSLEDSTEPRTQHPRRRVSRGRCLSTFVTRQERLAPMQSSGNKRTRSVLFLLHQHKLRTTAANGKKPKYCCDRSETSWMDFKARRFSIQRAKHRKKQGHLNEMCARRMSQKISASRPQSCNYSRPHHAAAFWEKHGWISKLGVSIPRAKQWKKARPSSGNSGRGIISQGLFASWPRSTYHADLPISRRWLRDREWASYAWQEDVAPFRTGDQMQIVFLGFTDKHHRPGSLRADKHSRILPLKSECPSPWNYH